VSCVSVCDKMGAHSRDQHILRMLMVREFPVSMCLYVSACLCVNVYDEMGVCECISQDGRPWKGPEQFENAHGSWVMCVSLSLSLTLYLFLCLSLSPSLSSSLCLCVSASASVCVRVCVGGDLMMLPSDIALIEDTDFKKWVEVCVRVFVYV